MALAARFLEQVAGGTPLGTFTRGVAFLAGAENPKSRRDVTVGNVLIAPRSDEGGLLIRYCSRARFPRSAMEILRFTNTRQTVFLGITDLSAANDRLVEPYGVNFPGVEMHARFRNDGAWTFLVPADNSTWLTVCVSLAAAGLIFWLLPGWTAYLLIARCWLVHYFLPSNSSREASYFGILSGRRLADSIGAATYRHFMMRGSFANPSRKSRATSKPFTGRARRCHAATAIRAPAS
jgi:hypothetical protein